MKTAVYRRLAPLERRRDGDGRAPRRTQLHQTAVIFCGPGSVSPRRHDCFPPRFGDLSHHSVDDPKNRAADTDCHQHADDDLVPVKPGLRCAHTAGGRWIRSGYDRWGFYECGGRRGAVERSVYPAMINVSRADHVLILAACRARWRPSGSTHRKAQSKLNRRVNSQVFCLVPPLNSGAGEASVSRRSRLLPLAALLFRRTRRVARAVRVEAPRQNRADATAPKADGRHDQTDDQD